MAEEVSAALANLDERDFDIRASDRDGNPWEAGPAPEVDYTRTLREVDGGLQRVSDVAREGGGSRRSDQIDPCRGRAQLVQVELEARLRLRSQRRTHTGEILTRLTRPSPALSLRTPLSLRSAL